MIFGSFKSEWSDRLARALANKPCEKPYQPIRHVYVDCGERPLPDELCCAPCSARRYVTRYPEESAS